MVVGENMTEMMVMRYDKEESMKTDKNNKKKTWESPHPASVNRYI
jgi:hypothetical protein